MEVTTASEDDGEPAKEATAGRGLSDDGAEDDNEPLGDTEGASEGQATGLEGTFGQLKICRNQLTVVIDGEELVCDLVLLASECRYFEAFTHFETSRHLDIKGAITFRCFKTISDFLGSPGGQLDIGVENFQELLQAALFLQCPRAEVAAISFISERLGRENVFRLHTLGLDLGCERLAATARSYIEKVFSPVLRRFSGSLEELLTAGQQQMEQLLNSDIQAGEDLLLFCLLAWLDADPLRHNSLALLHLISWRLLPAPCLCLLREDEEVLELAGVRERLAVAERYHSLRPDRQLDVWRELPELGERRWPKVVLAVSSGTHQGGLQYLDLSRACPMWRHLAKKPQQLRRKSTGSTMVYLHPMLYFLGGEQHWQLNWFDIEVNRWGVARGTPPGRLLSGAAVLGGDIYLVGGVTVEEWGGAQGSAGQVMTSCNVERYSVEEGRWEDLPPLDSGRSSPGVAVVGGWLYVVGGLQKREMLCCVCRFSPSSQAWEQLPPLPQATVYSTLLVRGEELWVVGGLDQEYNVQATTQVLDTLTMSWRWGPNLRQPRRGAFGWVQEERLYVCGGTGNGLKYLDSTELLDNQKGDWEAAKIAVKTWNCPVVCASARMPVRLLPQK